MKKYNEFLQIRIILIRYIVVLSSWLILFSSCSALKKTAKSDFGDNFYFEKTSEGKSRVYVHYQNEVIYVYKTQAENKNVTVDTLKPITIYKPSINEEMVRKIKFSRSSTDLDFFTIPIKYRFAAKGVPHQLNTTLNGTVYFGYRTDIYTLSYHKNQLNQSTRKVKHLGFSFGIFGGLGNAFLSPTTTNNNMISEYDGVVWNKGISGIIGIKNLTLGLTLGVDNLLDSNRDIWIYENKPWLGIALGLNLN